MEPKKISFGFSKITKKSNVFMTSKPPEKVETKIDLISCLEGQAIKLVDEKKDEPEKPLVIPLKDKSVTSSALLSMKLRQDVLNGTTILEKTEQHTNIINNGSSQLSSETIEMRAAREILESAQNRTNDDIKDNNLVLPIKSDDLPLDGASEPTINDYDNIPIEKFGLAMLRGMGWKDEQKKNVVIDDGPVLRPKGMGLGADKVIKKKAALVPPEPNEVLEIKKNAFVRILAGKYKDQYGQIEGMNEHAGRVFVKLALGGTRESVQEFLVQAVSKREYSQYGKVLNSAKYDEYKKMENGQIIKKEKLKNQYSSKDRRTTIYKEDKYSSSKSRSDRNENDRYSSLAKPSKRYSSGSECSDEEHKRRQKSNRERIRDSRQRRRTRSRSISTASSHSNYEHRSKKKSSKSKKNKSRDKSKYRQSSSEEDEKRHKKKTKKSKRSRSRSKGRK